MENTNFKDLLPLSVGNTHIINDSYVNQFDIAHRDKQDVTKIGQEAFKYEVYLKGLDKLPEIELEETPKPPANQLAFIATIPESFELGDEDVTITIETNADSYDGDIVNEAVAHYNRALDTITPLKVGDTEIVFTATKEEETQEFRFPIKVVDDIVDTPPQVAETPDNADESNFTDEELAVVLCNRARYEDLKEFYVEWAGLNGMNDEAQAKGALYQEMRQGITAIQAKEIAPTFKAMEIGRVKEATKFIGRMGALMSGGASGGGMFEWWEEVPTLVSTNSYEQESTEKLNSILAKHFVLPMNSKEDFLYNYYLTSMSGRGIGGYSGMLQVMEWYLAGAYEDSMWFIENLANIPLSKIEAYSFLSYIVNSAPYNTFSDEASKKEFASFYLSQLVMSGKTGGGNGKTREQILAEINVKSIDEKLDQVGEDFFNRARDSGVVLTQANFAVFNDSNMTPATGALIYVFASILAAAGKDTSIINVFNELFREQGISNTTKEQNIRVYRKIKTKFMELEVINKCVDFISVEQGFIYSQKNIETNPYESYDDWSGDGTTTGFRILEFGVYIFNITKLGKIEVEIPKIFKEYREFVNTGEQELYIAKEIDKAIIAKHKGS